MTDPSASFLLYLPFLCVLEGAPGTLEPTFLPPGREEIAAYERTGIMVPTHGRQRRAGLAGVMLQQGACSERAPTPPPAH